MKLIFKDLMKYAKKKGLILSNPYDDIEIKVNGCKPPNNPKDESRVYLPEEKEKLFRQLNKRLMQMPFETDAYVIFLLFKLGLRTGEAVALKWADIDWVTREIHIHRMESRVEDENGMLSVSMKKQDIQMGILFSVIKKAEPRFMRLITASVLSADRQELK